MSSQLNKTQSPLMLWGLGVGYVISGMYFGWNLGLKEGGSVGMAFATFSIIVMYICFSFSYAELACTIPKAGGAFDYTNRILGREWGFITGIVQVIEFVFAPPAIALGIGAHLNLLYPELPIIVYAIGAYFLFTSINIFGVKTAASFEFAVTIIALAGLVLFAVVSIEHFKFQNFQHNPLPSGYAGIFSSLPFAIWFFLGIEGVANVAEETLNPQKDITLGFGSAILTLIIVCIITFMLSVGVNGWEMIVYDNKGNLSDSPLPLALKSITENSLIYTSIVTVGAFGLVASFHGLLLAAGRATFELGRIKYAPDFLGKIHPRFQTPYMALLVNMTIGIIALMTGKTSEIIILSVFGALTLYMVSMVCLLRFRKTEPDANRPFKVPLYPFTPILSLILSVIAFISTISFYPKLFIVFSLIVVMSFAVFKIFIKLPDTNHKKI